MGILKKLDKNTEDCDLEEEQLFIRKGYDELWREVLILSRRPDSYNYNYNKIYDIFSEEVEKRRKHGRNSWLETSLITCPKTRHRRLYDPKHEECLDNYTWEIFHNQMRSRNPEKYITVLLMCIETVFGETICRVEENDDNFHAEENAINFLKTIKSKKINMYVSRSPCKRICLPKIKRFIKNQNTIESFRIRFSSIHEHYDYDEMKLLHELDANIGVFNDEDWDHLERHLMDDQIRQEFKEMNDQREGATSEIEDYTTETSSIQESDNDSENCYDNHYESRSECSSDTGSTTDFDDDINKKNEEDENGIQNEDNESKDEIFIANDLKRKTENNSPDEIYIKRFKKPHPIKYDDDDDD